MKNPRHLLVIFFLVTAILLSFSVPVRKQQKPDVLSKLHIPRAAGEWKGEDISKTFMDPRDQKYNFIDRVFGAEYRNPSEDRITFSITESGHFHDPQVCYRGAGFEVREFPDSEITVCGRPLNVYLCHASKTDGGFLSVYWLCVDKTILNWWGQLRKQLLSSLLNRTPVSFMVRVDMPVKEGDLEKAVTQVRQFTEDLAKRIPEEDKEFIFGK